MSMQWGVAEILKRASEIPSREARINYLRGNAGKPVQIVLQYALDPNVKWLVSSKLPPYNPCVVPEGLETQLLAEARRLYLFTEYEGIPQSRVNISKEKREVLFVQLLEMLSPEDITLLQYAIEKKLPYPNLSYDVIKEAFPHILPGLDTVGASPLHDTAIASYNIFETNGDPLKTLETAPSQASATAVIEEPVKRGRGRPKKAK